jgi:hypothetical protein
MNSSITKLLGAFCTWLEQTPLSQTIQATNWIVPTVQIIHILAVAAVISSVLMIDLRLIRAFGTDQRMKDVSSRFLPCVWWPLIVLLATGAIMILGEPARSLMNPAFQLKMMILAAALIITFLFQFLQRRNLTFGDSTSEQRSTEAAIAVLSVLLWSGIVFAGRWIAYY